MDADAAPFGDAVAAGLLTEPIIINVHHLRYGKNGEIAARKIAKKVLKAGTLGEHVKLDHPARRKQLSRKARDEDDLMDVVKRESNGYGYQQRGEGYRPPLPPPVQNQRRSSESSDASVEVLDGPPVEARPSSRKGRYKNAPSSSVGSASRGSKDSRGIAQDSSSGSTSRGTKDSGSASTSKASKRARP
ncbi:hypothetical protein A4X03_0g8130 [Tilletia caries]|uniref:Uncharacterized protein n=2 Tax=Tilletia caries TaxID=13290 RepID=A0A8T8SKI6_9BASI|nr:hypothetical protein CF328_g8233 [Tilletia controversa]KAE8183923.1 hypothetical protein CF335_g8177 [Tilletia laevis]KAE8241562.1 hypothetical protein A4X03_0g8130 [Tilletia caries]